GKRYIMYTDTRRYVGRTRVNQDTQAGADTVMVLTDRDGVSVIDINDDIPGGNTLDSQIEFIPEVDGFYFVQIKNVGDVGNQFIRYDLVLLLCLPGQTDCGRTTITGLPINPITPVPTGTPDREFVLDQPTAPPTATNTATPVP
ncbi:MAG: peptidase, partial [Chloroflexia bacterium]|nr:peptidase [Chloroflexia bacterium]